MAAHTLMVISIMFGHTVTWGNQHRDADGTSWCQALRVHAFPTALGVVWSVIAWNISLTFTAWISPILLGLVLSIPVSVWTSRARCGKALARHKILSNPEEIDPPAVIRPADEAKAVVDPCVNGVHISLLEPSELLNAGEALAERCLNAGPGGLTKNELSELLYLAPAMLMMHHALWLRSLEGIHRVWTTAVESYRRRLDQPLLTEPS